MGSSNENGFKYKYWRARKILSERLDFRIPPVFTCNVCGHKSRKPYDSPVHVSPLFQTETIIGGGFRAAQKCPTCSANDRLRFVVEVLKRETDIFTKPCSVLEMAPVKGFRLLLKKKNRKASYLSGDIVPGRAMRVLDITKLDLENESFDYIICCHVMEHILDEGKAISELKRVLKPGGVILLSMPVCISKEHTFEDSNVTSAEERLRVFGQEDHVRLYALDTAAHLRNFGLNVREIIADDSWKEEIKKYKLISGDRCYLCKKI